MLRYSGHGHGPQQCASCTTPCLTTARGGGSAARGANTRPAGAGAACIPRPLLDSGRVWCSCSLVTGHLCDGDEMSTALVPSGEACCASHTLVTLHPHTRCSPLQKDRLWSLRRLRPVPGLAFPGPTCWRSPAIGWALYVACST